MPIIENDKALLVQKCTTLDELYRLFHRYDSPSGQYYEPQKIKQDLEVIVAQLSAKNLTIDDLFDDLIDELSMGQPEKSQRVSLLFQIHSRCLRKLDLADTCIMNSLLFHIAVKIAGVEVDSLTIQLLCQFLEYQRQLIQQQIDDMPVTPTGARMPSPDNLIKKDSRVFAPAVVASRWAWFDRPIVPISTRCKIALKAALLCVSGAGLLTIVMGVLLNNSHFAIFVIPHISLMILVVSVGLAMVAYGGFLGLQLRRRSQNNQVNALSDQVSVEESMSDDPDTLTSCLEKIFYRM